ALGELLGLPLLALTGLLTLCLGLLELLERLLELIGGLALCLACLTRLTLFELLAGLGKILGSLLQLLLHAFRCLRLGLAESAHRGLIGLLRLGELLGGVHQPLLSLGKLTRSLGLGRSGCLLRLALTLARLGLGGLGLACLRFAALGLPCLGFARFGLT